MASVPAPPSAAIYNPADYNDSELTDLLASKQNILGPNNRLDAEFVGTGEVSTGTFNHISTVTSSVQDQLSDKQGTISSTNRIAADFIGTGVVTNAVFAFLAGVTSSIQAQLGERVLLSGNQSLTGLLTIGSAIANGRLGFYLGTLNTLPAFAATQIAWIGQRAIATYLYALCFINCNTNLLGSTRAFVFQKMTSASVVLDLFTMYNNGNCAVGGALSTAGNIWATGNITATGNMKAALPIYPDSFRWGVAVYDTAGLYNLGTVATAPRLVVILVTGVNITLPVISAADRGALISILLKGNFGGVDVYPPTGELLWISGTGATHTRYDHDNPNGHRTFIAYANPVGGDVHWAILQ